jgi:cell division septal protein FtsQ
MENSEPEKKSQDTSFKARLKEDFRKFKKPALYAFLAMLPFVILWVIVVWFLAKCT